MNDMNTFFRAEEELFRNFLLRRPSDPDRPVPVESSGDHGGLRHGAAPRGGQTLAGLV